VSESFFELDGEAYTGEWICMHAVTLPEPNGIGMADTQLFDARGPIGRAAQTLLIADRS
jgi:hypothetical protein